MTLSSDSSAPDSSASDPSVPKFPGESASSYGSLSLTFSDTNPYPAWVWLVGIALLLLPLVGYGLLPALGINTFAHKLGLPGLIKLTGLMVGGAVGLIYYKYILERPPIAVPFFMMVYWQLFNQLQAVTHVNFHLRLVLIAAFSVPTLFYLARLWPRLGRDVPFFYAFLLFYLVNLIYFKFYAIEIYDLNNFREGTWVSADFGTTKVITHSMTLMGMVLTYAAFALTRFPQALLLKICRHLLWLTAALSVLFTVTHPFKLYSTMLDGFLRAYGFLSHPNPYAHHMGLVLLLFVGLMVLGQQNPSWRLKGIGWGVLASCFGFLVGLSKTAILAFILASSVFWIPQLLDPKNRFMILKLMVWAIIGLVAVNFGFAWLSDGQTLLDILTQRIQQTNSVDSRMGDWWILINNITWKSIWLGHGHGGANQAILLQQFSDNNGQPVLNIHNGYLETLYDYGLLGLSVVLGALMVLWQGFKTALSLPGPAKALGWLAVSFAIYFLVVLSFDEILYMFDASHLFWMMSIMVLTVAQRVSLQSKSFVQSNQTSDLSEESLYEYS